MKKIVTGISLATLLVSLAACSPTEETIVETSFGNISKEEFYNELKSSNGATVLQKMIDDKLLTNKYEIEQKELQEEIDSIKSQFASDEDFLNTLVSYGIADEDAFKEQVTADMLRFKAATDGVEVTDEILKKYYDENKNDFETVKAQHILVKTEEEALDIKKKLTNGEDFSKLATEFSTDTQSANNGGELGEFKKGQMVPEFDLVAFTIEPNVVSEVVKTDFGFHIIKVSERTVKSFDDNHDEIKRTYLDDNAKPYEEVMGNLSKEAKLKIKDKELKTKMDAQNN